MIIEPYKKFLESVSLATREKWAAALRRAHKAGIKQAKNRMYWRNANSVGMCCLMVGHEAFGGTDAQRDHERPNSKSPFTQAFGDEDPYIAICDGRKRTGSYLNDDEKLNFLQIADVIMGKEVEI